MIYSLAQSSARLLTPIGLLLICSLLSACINQAGNANPYRAYAISPEKLDKAKQQGFPYVKNRRGHLQTIKPITFYTEEFGRVRILPNYVSDGSSRPFDSDHGSNMAALLHDALYRGAPQMTFPDGYPGRWTRQQADAAYCLQLKLQNASETNQKINCRGVNLMGVSHGVWKYHAKKRKSYWKKQEEILRKKQVNQLFISPS